MPQFWIVGGPNGAGKTTLADRWLAPRINIISPDAIAFERRVSAFNAGRQAVVEQERQLAAQTSFGIDTTFSGNRELQLMARARQLGYKVNLIFIGVSNAVVCQARITERVASGGHFVPSEDVIRRFERSLSNLAASFDIADRVFVLDNSERKHKLLLSLDNGRVKYISANMPEWAKSSIPQEVFQLRRQSVER